MKKMVKLFESPQENGLFVSTALLMEASGSFFDIAEAGRFFDVISKAGRDQEESRALLKTELDKQRISYSDYMK